LPKKFRQEEFKYADDWLADDFVEHQIFPGTTPCSFVTCKLSQSELKKVL
jgi:hypothetical protein